MIVGIAANHRAYARATAPSVRRSHHRVVGCGALALTLLFGSGCLVEKEKYTQALGDLQFARNQVVDRDQKLAAVRQELESLQGDIRERDAKLTEATTDKADLVRKLDEAAVLNAAIQERLQKAGQNVSQLSSEKGSLTAALEDTKARLEELRKQQAAAEARAAQFQDLIKRFDKLADAGKLKVVLRDGRMLIELPNDVLFDSSKADLKGEGKTTLVEVAKVLRTLPDRKFQVAGHTDNVKIATAKYPSNWELSTARAVTVARLMVDNGVKPQNVSAAGYGEFDPAASNDTAESRAKNRRIEITLVPNLDELVKPAAPTSPPAKAAPPPTPARKS